MYTCLLTLCKDVVIGRDALSKQKRQFASCVYMCLWYLGNLGRTTFPFVHVLHLCGVCCDYCRAKDRGRPACRLRWQNGIIGGWGLL